MPGVIPEKVNEEQRRAVEHGEGPLRIVAGTGTGKTPPITSPSLATSLAQEGI